MNIIKTLSILLTAVYVFSAHAAEDEVMKKHTFGGQFAVGGAEYKSASNDGDGIAQFYAFYNYAINPNFSLEVGFNGGADIDDWDCDEYQDGDWYCSEDSELIFGLVADDVEYSNFVMAVKGTLPLSRRNSLYAKAGANYYDYDISRRDHLVASESDVGLFLEAGWQYRFDFGLGLSAGWQYFDMGDLETYSISTGVNYQF